MKQQFRPLALAIAVFAAGTSAGSAALISGVGAPSSALSGSVTVVDFETATLGAFTTATFGNLTISGSGGNGNAYISNDFAGLPGFGANYLENQDQGFTEFIFSFATPVSGFAFNLLGNWGFEGVDWTLEAFDGVTSLGSYILPHNDPSYGLENGAEFFGVTGSGISSIRLFADGQDWILLDNLSFTEETQTSVIPEPGSIMALGLLLASGTFFRSRRKSKN